MIRMLFLLRWFVAPIFLLHALLSPGQLLLPGTLLPITREGVVQGLWLSIHFVTIFVAAMLLFRLLRRSEWLYGILSAPLLGRRLLIYLLMISAMKKNIGEQLGHMRQQWRLRPDWRSAALFMLAAFRLALATGREQAWMLWLRWPGNRDGMSLDTPAGEAIARQSTASNITWLLLALVTLVLV